eukprot:5034132-Amphidinium_carterae.1
MNPSSRRIDQAYAGVQPLAISLASVDLVYLPFGRDQRASGPVGQHSPHLPLGPNLPCRLRSALARAGGILDPFFEEGFIGFRLDCDVPAPGRILQQIGLL